MTDYTGSRKATPLTWILSLLAAGFVIQSAFETWTPLRNLFPFTSFFALSSAGIRHGHVWQLATYSFLHGSILHILLNGLGLYFMGREVLSLVGGRRFVGIFIGSTVLGGLTWLAVHFNGPGTVIGCSGAVCAMLVVFACFYPDREITFLLFFVIPVTMKPKYIAFLAAGIDLCGFLFGELPGGSFDTGFAHSAHLGGMLAGLLYFRFIHRSTWLSSSASASVELPRWLKRSGKAALPADFKINLSNRDSLRAEVDRILDKINSSGFGALTPEEKRVLDEARDLLSRR